MKRIIHLSDLHVGHQDMHERFEHIIKMIKFTKPEAEKYVIVLTGDLVERATEKNYEQAKECIDFLRKERYTVLPIPGNHDYSEGLYHSKRNVKKFKKAFFEKDDDFFQTDREEYPKIDIIGQQGERIAFIGLDSMADELHWYDSLWANGEIGEKQLKRMDERLREERVVECKYKVVYLHHHIFAPLHPTHELKDTDKFVKHLKEYMEEDGEKHKINALCFGHNHHGHIWNGQLGIPRCYDGGTSTSKANGSSPHRVIDLSRDPINDYDGNFLRGYPF
ncbi:MAG: metallophosphoesterase [Candidatus Aminicenantes bacterium]|nr:metallophosphoesterase [Candidatus Aminicenantes bacterium]